MIRCLCACCALHAGCGVAVGGGGGGGDVRVAYGFCCNSRNVDGSVCWGGQCYCCVDDCQVHRG